MDPLAQLVAMAKTNLLLLLLGSNFAAAGSDVKSSHYGIDEKRFYVIEPTLLNLRYTLIPYLTNLNT